MTTASEEAVAGGHQAPSNPKTRHSSTKASWRLDLMEGKATMMSSSSATASKLADKGRVTNTLQSPRDKSMARRRFSSIIGPKMKPNNKGAGSMPSLMKV